MFTGIIEDLGIITHAIHENGNLQLKVKSSLTSELKIDQSISHNGVCLTVVSIDNEDYSVTAIQETLAKSNLNELEKGDVVNLERAMKIGDRLDGHIVQGHVDQVAICKDVISTNGSWLYTFEYSPNANNITIEKGSITVNGVSLTVVNSKKTEFSVAIIPYTFENTSFKNLVVGSSVNIEFDVVGKYVQKLFSFRH